MSLTVLIKVVPSSGRQKALLDKQNNIKIFLKNPPEKGKANAELIKFLSKNLKLPQSTIIIITGASSRKKHIKIDAKISFDELCRKLGIERQLSI